MAVSVVLAGRNSIHTWWTGMLGCALFAAVFLDSKLYANVALQVFLFVTCTIGWWRWLHHERSPAREFGRGPPVYLAFAAVAGVLGAIAYGAMLSRHTDAQSPFADSLVLMFSVIAQLLLLRRRIESWWFWIVVNLIAVPLFASRGLYLTSALYAGYLLNAAIALHHWKNLEQAHAGAR